MFLLALLVVHDISMTTIVRIACPILPECVTSSFFSFSLTHNCWQNLASHPLEPTEAGRVPSCRRCRCARVIASEFLSSAGDWDDQLNCRSVARDNEIPIASAGWLDCSASQQPKLSFSELIASLRLVLGAAVVVVNGAAATAASTNFRWLKIEYSGIDFRVFDRS